MRVHSHGFYRDSGCQILSARRPPVPGLGSSTSRLRTIPSWAANWAGRTCSLAFSLLQCRSSGHPLGRNSEEFLGGTAFFWKWGGGVPGAGPGPSHPPTGPEFQEVAPLAGRARGLASAQAWRVQLEAASSALWPEDRLKEPRGVSLLRTAGLALEGVPWPLASPRLPGSGHYPGQLRRWLCGPRGQSRCCRRWVGGRRPTRSGMRPESRLFRWWGRTGHPGDLRRVRGAILNLENPGRKP